MREIKFRAWHKGAKEMLHHSSQGYEGNVFQWLHEGQPIIIMQYTGLKDKQGKEIYEGDIVKLYEYGNDIWMPVIFKNGCFCIHGFNWDVKNCEIIGNIYENPELLRNI